MNRKHDSFFRMDEQVVYTMACICLLSLLLLAFRFINNKPCTSVNIGYGQDSIFVNDVVHFVTDAKSGNDFSWNFGDGDFKKEEASTINHKYSEARTYIVKLVVNQECTDMKTVVVYDRKPAVVQPLMPEMNSPETAFVNEPVSFSDESPTSTTWEWYFENNPVIYSRQRNVTYTFLKPGEHKIRLVINKKPELSVIRYIYINKISEDRIEDAGNKQPNTVNRQKPPDIIIQAEPVSEPLKREEKDSIKTPPPVIVTPPIVVAEKPKKAPEISDPQLEEYLTNVYEGKKTTKDFSEYFMENAEVKIRFDGTDYTSFNDVCNALRSDRGKKIRKLDVFATKNKNNYIISMLITAKRKSIAF